MAEIVVSAFLSVFFEKLASEAWKKIARAKGIDSELKKLKRSLIQINALLNDASQKEITDVAVKEWLNDLQHVAYEIDDVLDDLATEAMHRELTEESQATTSKVRKLIPTCCTNFSASTRTRGKLDNITTKLQELVEEKNNLGLTVKGESPKHMNRKLQTSLVDASSIVGREHEKDTLLHKLLGDEPCDKNFSIVPIVGMGGVGKTTLARLLYDEFQGNDHFELKAWVCVSDEFDIFGISKTIFQSIEGGNQDFKDLNLLQVALKEKISKKRFLVVLDDVWSESYTDWAILERPFLEGAPGSKVIITTRKLSLLNQLGHDQPFHLSVLSHDTALSLFCQHALGENNFDSHLILKPHGKGIVEKCDGLPLALIALGRLLRTKRDEEEWKELLNSEIWRLGKRDEIIPALRLSYYDLSASLKQLFAYCSLFPKDYVFNKEKLILLWMAEGFLHNENINKSMERLGLEYFEDLLSRPFFQHAVDDKSLFVMHDLMNDLATSVAGDYFLNLDIEMKKELRKEALEKYRHVSFACESYMVYKRFEPFKGAKNLRTFLAMPVGMIESWTTFYLSHKVLVDLLHELPLLRVLSLSHLSIKEVPEVIGSLKHLRYLNLSHTSITHLPENVCNLYNLQTLILSGCCYITKFPNSFIQLRNLRHLDIRNTPGLKKMCSGIGELKNLHTLSKIIIGGENSFAITELKNLQNLHGKISIWGLGNVQNAMEAREANLSQKRLSELELDWGYGDYELNVFRMQTHDKEVLNELKPYHNSLKKLEIVSYGGTEFPNWVGNPSFLVLTHISIYFCEECTYLPSLGQLPSLKELFILGMSKVKVIDQKLLGTGVAFPSLEILSFRHMSGWEVWSTDNSGVVDTAFPCLQELHIESCPNLVQVSLKALPSLRVLKLQRCGHVVLTSLVHVASSVTELEIDDISGLTDELWRSVFRYLVKLEKLFINGCNEIRYLWQSEAEANKFLVNLWNLHVTDCSNLVSLGEKAEDNYGNIHTFIRMLSIARCQSMEHCSCPKSIEFLNIHGCDSITSVSFPTGGKKLKSFSIGGCQKLLEEELGGEKSRLLINSSMQMLESVEINGWLNLKSIIELSFAIHLTTLMITKCPIMESFPVHELPNLTSLTHLVIVKCPSIDASFPRGLWPPKLRFLGIGGLKKPISEWGPQNFPTSLDNLMLYGGLYNDVKNFDGLSHLLPSSLTSLSIMEFEKLESVSMGLQHLTSLQHLSVSKCSKMLHLPEKLFPSLLSLRINRCPNLKERSIRRSSYWPLISRVPVSTFDE